MAFLHPQRQALVAAAARGAILLPEVIQNPLLAAAGGISELRYRLQFFPVPYLFFPQGLFVQRNLQAAYGGVRHSGKLHALPRNVMAADRAIAHENGQGGPHLHGIPAFEAFPHLLHGPRHIVGFRTAMLP